MKKLYCVMIAAVCIMSVLLTGCSSKDNTETAPETTPADETVETSEEQTEASETEEEAGEDVSWEYIEEKGELILGLDDSFPPMGFVNDDQEIVGFDIDLAAEVCRRLDVELVLQPVSWTAKEQELETQNIDCIWNGLTVTEERLESMTMSESYMKNTQVIVVVADSEIASVDDLEGKEVVAQNASTAVDAIEAIDGLEDSFGELILVDNNVQAMLDLEIGGSDAVIMDEVVARYYTETEANAGKFKVLDESLADEEYAVAFRRGDDALCEKVNAALKEMAEDGTMASISEKWFGTDITMIQ